MKFIPVCLWCLMFAFAAQAQDGPGNNFEGYKPLDGGSYIKVLRKGQSTAVADTGGACFLKVSFLTENDSVFIDVNEEGGEESYPFRIDAPAYNGDFIWIISRLHPGDSVKYFMSLDSLKKYYPDEFVFDEPYNSMKYLGMAVGVDSVYSKAEIEQWRADEEKRKSDIIRNDAVQLSVYLRNNKFPDKPNEQGIWFRTLKAGNSKAVAEGDSLVVHYSCMYPDGTFEIESDTLNYLHGDGETIPGWYIGIGRMHEKEKAIIIVPTSLGYQDGHTLIFEVEILSLKHN